MATAISIEHPHSSHDRTQEWLSCCMEIFMGRDPKGQRLHVEEPSEDDDDDDSLGLGGWSSPDCVALDMTKDATDPPQHDPDACADVDPWMWAALALSGSLDDVSGMIRRKAAPYASSTDVLDTCFDCNSAETDHAMTHAERAMLETTVASASMQLTQQIEALRRTAAGPGGPGGPDGPRGHRAGIAASLLQRLRSEVVEPMTRLQSQREKSAAAQAVAGELARHPLRRFRLGAEESRRRALPPAPWEVDGHDAERDRAERDEERRDFLDAYFEEEETSALASEEEIGTHLLPPLSVLRCMELPEPVPADRPRLPQQQPALATPPAQLQPTQHLPAVYGEEEEEHRDRLHQEAAVLLASYQHSDLEGVQKVERSMVDITQLLSRFTDLITEQQEEIVVIHDQAVKSKDNVDQGQDQLVDAASRGAKTKHPMASFIVAMALLLLLFNWILP